LFCDEEDLAFSCSQIYLFISLVMSECGVIRRKDCSIPRL